MDVKEQKILDTFEKLIPILTEKEKARVLDMGELMVFLKSGLSQEDSKKNDEEIIRGCAAAPPASREERADQCLAGSSDNPTR